jgi:hypothetical protein
MIGYTEQQRMIREAIAQFPAVFGLAAFPGETFRISLSASYVNDAEDVMLYTQIYKGGQWLDFAKGYIAELSDNVMPAPLAQIKAGDKVTLDGELHLVLDIRLAASGKPFELDYLALRHVASNGTRTWSTGGYFPHLTKVI